MTAAVAAMFLVNESAHAQNTENDYTGGPSSSVLTSTSWSLGHLPTVNNDAVFNNGTGIRTFNDGSLTVGSWNVTVTGTYTIRNSTSNTTSTLTLGGAGDLGNGVSGTAADLLYATSGTFTIAGANGTALINVVLGQSGHFDAASTINVDAVISDGGNNFSITKTGAGTLRLSGANTFGGGLTLSAGTLQINNAAAPGTGTFTINAGTITNTSGAAITLSNNNAQTWGGDFTYAGTSSTYNLNLGTGAVTLTGNRTINASGTTSTLTVGGVIGDSGNGYSLMLGTGGTGTLILSGANTYSGGTVVNSGTLQLSGSGTLGSTSGTLTVNGTASSKVDLNGTNETVGALNGTGGSIFNNNASTASALTVGNGNATGSYAGVIGGGTGAGTSLVKTGGGTQTLTGANTYTGATTINNGTLLVNGANSGTGTVMVNNSGSLGGTGSVAGATTVNGGGTITGANNGTVGSLTLKNTATFSGASGSLARYLVDLSSTSSDTLAISGALNLSGSFDQIQFQGTTGASSYTLATYSSVEGTFDAVTGLPTGYTLNYGTNALTLTAVPEPSTWVAGAFALLAVGYTQRRRLVDLLGKRRAVLAL